MFYIFQGDDEHSKKEFLNQLQDKLGDPAMVELNTRRFEGSALTLSELKHACDSVPFLSDRRLVIVSDLFTGNPSFLDELLDYIPRIPDTTRLVFLESRMLSSKHPVIRLAQESDEGYVKSFERLKGNELVSWVQRRVKAGNGQIEHRAAHLLATNVGNNLALLENEIEKLLLYKSGDMIEAEDVSLLCPYVAEASIFDLVDSLGSRHRQTAPELLQKKLNEGTDPAYLFSMIVRQYRLLIQVKELHTLGLSSTEIAGKLNIPGFVSVKLIQQSQNYRMEQLERIYAHLLDIDIEEKTSQTELATSLNLLAAGLVF